MNKVLIIDDERNILDSLSGILEDEGFSVLKATDGKEGLAIFEREAPDVVLLDVWMPELDGIQVLKEIRTRKDDAKVVVISGHGTISTAVEAVKMGAYDFLEKPLFHRQGARGRLPQHRRRFKARPVVADFQAGSDARAHQGKAEDHRKEHRRLRGGTPLRGENGNDPPAHAGEQRA
jgi:DNA-binding NtrC family response regulator